MEDGGYGGVVTIEDPEDLNIIDEFDGVGGKFTSSYAPLSFTLVQVVGLP